MKELLNSINNGIIVMQPDGCIQVANDYASQIFEIDADDLKGCLLTTLLKDNDTDENPSIESIIALSGVDKNFLQQKIVAGMLPSGKNVPLEIGVAETSIGGNLVYTITLKDMTRVIRVEQALQESQESYYDLYHNAADMFLSVDKYSGRIIKCNQTIIETTGYTHDELLNMHIDDICCKMEENDTIDFLNILSIGEIQNYEHQLIVASGGHLDVSMNVSYEYDGKKIKTFHLIWRDITLRKRAEKAKHDRTALTEAVKGMEQVIGVIGHELRTPLAALRAMTEYLTSDSSISLDEMEKYLKLLHDEVMRMSDTVNQVLETARLNSGCAKWQWDNVLMAIPCEEAIESMTPLIQDKNITLSFDMNPFECSMMGDAEAVRRLLINLLSNAIKYTHEGSIGLFVTEDKADEKSWIVIEVRDTGEGMSEEIASKLGEPFALNSGLVGGDHVKGTGLGLTICKGIVAAHGGSISVTSILGAGSTFTIRLRADLEKPNDLKNDQVTIENKLDPMVLVKK